ncbi:TerB family tellurite resistance protein [Magnetospirillum sulfuroxidans]|uniref:TerB family tellurite resistance protein n=1 Tax=Magnetospirillum sulfuroxidans TaxID=611300 RepID=A0ABS5IEX7_9PROT|nr:TerB family tellurite resistance protein [Magnetospirillum sulfuroxidans]MBR9972954.1 TerB family tellurite resistance protein [Magnetospirillum sulfuroxidans]
MFGRLRALFVSNDDGVSAQRRLQLAAAAVLAEAASLDGQVDEVEQRRITELLARHFQLSQAEAQDLLAEASVLAQQSVQLVGFARTIKDGFEASERIELIEMLWDVAYADGHLHEYEANLVRRIAGLIHVPDQDAGAARKRVMARLGIQ